ncbi:MAG: transcription termination factor Rho [Actinobacteria bacterium]|nr:transcription termination factor Rho [Actinomycetota bacterium]MDA2952236.1 transcription termination factor Rho [Actinomycetota bacterium]MDA2998525.1 transcription termination factor Rho [Actinomycetota bacterium]
MASGALEQSALEAKDREQLVAIAGALGVKSASRAKKAELIEMILEQTKPAEVAPKPAKEEDAPKAEKPAAKSPAPAGPVLGADGEPLADWEIELAEHEGTPVAPDARRASEQDRGDRNANRNNNDRGDRNSNRHNNNRNNNDRNTGDRGERDNNRTDGGGFDNNRNRNRNRRRRGKGPRDEGPQGNDRYETIEPESNEPISTEPVKVSGYVDLRDEGYGFLRVNGYLPSREDSYISVRLTRQYGLRKGDHVSGMSKPAGRNEKNPAMLDVETINNVAADQVKNRPRFEDLTPLFPDSKLGLENAADPNNMTARIIDLIAPIGKGQRGIIVSPPKAGKTTVMKTIATSIEKNHPEVKLIVLLIDERPEEVTDMRRTVKGEVIASTFDRPSEEHTHIAELTIEKAKRMVEMGEDVVIILDGITRLSRAYNLAAPATGRIMSGGIDAGALYPPKKFFGAARNIEEGGSLTILATALVETNSRMDDAIFEEFKGTGNMELRLDRKVAERRIYPAIDVDASSTRHEELLFERKQLQMVWKLRRVLSGLAADGNAAPGLELLIDRLKTFKNNDDFLNEIAKQPTT